MSNIDLGTGGPPETILPDADPRVVEGLEAAAAIGDPEEQRAAVADVVAGHPRSIDAWAALGERGRDVIERYAAYRVGYHRGLDTLRQNGWRGSGYVRWEHPSNRGFLRALNGLHRACAEIGENDEAERTAVFLRQLDPSWPPSELA